MASLSQQRYAEEQVRSWGFATVHTWTDPPNTHYQAHRHVGLSTHLILSGDLTICYLEDAPGAKETFGPGASIDVPAGKVHEVWMGANGCTYVVGI